MIVNRMATVTSVSAMAISGEATATAAERSARRSSINGMLDLWPVQGSRGIGSAHQQSKLFARNLCGCDWRRQATVEHNSDAVRDFFKFVEILADDQHRRAAPGKIDQGLADDRSRAGIDAPGRLADDKNPRLAKYLATNDEFLQVAAREADRLRIAFGLAHIERIGRAIDVSKRRLLVDETPLHHAAGGVAGQQGVFRQLHTGRGAMAKPLLRHVGGAHAAAFGHAENTGRVSVDHDRASRT